MGTLRLGCCGSLRLYWQTKCDHWSRLPRPRRVAGPRAARVGKAIMLRQRQNSRPKTGSRCRGRAELHLAEQIRDSYTPTQIFTSLLFSQCPSAVKSFPASSPQLSLAPLNFPTSIPPKMAASYWPASRPKCSALIGQDAAMS